jgi:peptidoglycan/LPS O-acetylase OafA/YrhL
MDTNVKDRFSGILIVPLGLGIVLVPFSLIIGWNLITLLLFWFVVIPALAIYLPTKVSKSRNHLLESLTGLLLFYGIMTFMIYNHYKTDYFQVMMASCVVNVAIVAAISAVKKHTAQIR